MYILYFAVYKTIYLLYIKASFEKVNRLSRSFYADSGQFNQFGYCVLTLSLQKDKLSLSF